MDLDVIVLSEISQTERDKYCMISLLCGSGKTKNSNWGKNELVDTDNRLTVSRSGDGECVKMVKKYKLPVIR